MLKAKKYDWKDSNLALFGSDTEKKVKKEAAETEEAWAGCGQRVGLNIWRIVQFKVQTWPENEYGTFYSGDSYIVLHTYIKPGEDKLRYDLHFWIGKYSTQDEYGTAAYKTVELDCLLSDEAVQHRETQGNESSLFKSYFPSITIRKGGAKSGFRHVEEAKAEPKLYHFSNDCKTVKVYEKTPYKEYITSDDVFIIDSGDHLYQCNGARCDKMEKFSAAGYLQDLEAKRKVRSTILDEQTDGFSSIMQYLKDREGGKPKKVVPKPQRESIKRMLEISEEDGKCKIEDVAEGDSVCLGLLNPDNCFIVDVVKHVFVWVGGRASQKEKKNGLGYAHNYLKGIGYPDVPISVLKQGMDHLLIDALQQ